MVSWFRRRAGTCMLFCDCDAEVCRVMLGQSAPCQDDHPCASGPTGLTSTLQSEYAALTASAAGPDATESAAAAQPSAGDEEAQAAEHPAPQPLVYLVALAPPLGIALAHPGSFLTLLSVRTPAFLLRSCTGAVGAHCHREHAGNASWQTHEDLDPFNHVTSSLHECGSLQLLMDGLCATGCWGIRYVAAVWRDAAAHGMAAAVQPGA